MIAEYEIRRDNDKSLYISNEPITFNALHFHQNLEIAYVTDGEKEIIINDKVYVLHANQLAIIDNYDLHAYPKVAEKSTIIIVIPRYYLIDYENIKNNRALSHNVITDYNQAKEIFFWIDLLMNKPKQTELITRGLINLLIGQILQNISFVPKKNNEDINLIRAILLFLNQNFTKKISLDDLSKNFNLSKCYFSRIFSKYFKTNLPDFLNSLRVKNVVSLMRASNHGSLISAIFDSGFDSVPTFYRSFKKIYGTSPLKYI